VSESLKNLSELSDAKLAELVKSGNDSAFDVLTLRYLRNIGFLAKKYSADGYERNDFVQEGLLGLLYACRTFDSNNKASFSYVDIVAKRRFISIVRKAQRQKAVPSSSLVSLDADNDELEGESTDPEQLMLAKEHYSLLLDELKTLLSEREYTVLMLYCGGMSYVEAAKKLGISAKSADNALQRAKKKISLHYMSLKD
jgi:RNA polymerase sporulation-specific sigma factor